MSDPNVARSVLDRLRNEARGTGEAFNPLLTRYVGFRLLYRLSRSEHRDRYFVKGATMFLVWTGATHRPTQDVDLFGLASQEESEIVRTFRDLCRATCPEDGVAFDPESVRAEPIREEQAYGGVRVRLIGRLGDAQVRLRFDVGFGDAVTPEAREVELPGIVRDVPPVRLLGYPVETAVAEKLHALAVFGLENSRMKDFFDLACLADAMEFDADVLTRAVRATFARRRTALPAGVPVALTPAFFENDLVATRWRAFVRKNAIRPPHDDLPTVIRTLRRFLLPLLDAAGSRESGAMRWRRGEWQELAD